MFDGIKVDPHLVIERAGFAAKEFNVTAPIPHVYGESVANVAYGAGPCL